MSVILPYRFACRRWTAAEWESLNEVLLNSEIGVVTDSGNPRAFKIGDGSTPWNSLPVRSMQFAVASGTNTLTATFIPKPVLFDGAMFEVRAAAANTGAATFNPNSIGALAITKQGGTALAAGDIAAAGHELILRYRASPARYELLNPATSAGGSTPTGTGFRHVTSGTEDAAAKLVDTADINNGAVTLGKQADVATGTVFYRKTAGTGSPEVQTLATLKTDMGLSSSGITPVTDIFTTNGTYTPPTGATRCRVTCIGAGAGGGSGRKGAAASNRFGGGGGGAGGRSEMEFKISDLTGTVAVTVGIGSAGGASVTANTTNGNNGAVSSLRDSLFGPYLMAEGGRQGTGGQATVGTGGLAGDGLLSTGATGGNGSSGSGSNGGLARYASSGGGGGGGVPTGNTANPGGQGGVQPTFYPGTLVGGVGGVVAGPTTGGNGNAYAGPLLGTGGGGGASSITGNAGAGGNGVGYGAGGGGGGASVNSVGDSGAGGNGADGVVVVVSW